MHLIWIDPFQFGSMHDVSLYLEEAEEDEVEWKISETTSSNMKIKQIT